MHARVEHASFMQKDPRPGLDPRNYLLKSNRDINNKVKVSICFRASLYSQHLHFVVLYLQIFLW